MDNETRRLLEVASRKDVAAAEDYAAFEAMEKRGLVVEKPSPRSKRLGDAYGVPIYRIWHLTPAGAQALRE